MFCFTGMQLVVGAVILVMTGAVLGIALLMKTVTAMKEPDETAHVDR